MGRLLRELSSEIKKQITKNGLPICDILIAFASAGLIIKVEPLWGSIAVICFAAFIIISWYITVIEEEASIQRDE